MKFLTSDFGYSQVVSSSSPAMGSLAWGQFSGEGLTYPFHPPSLVSLYLPAPHLVLHSASIWERTLALWIVDIHWLMRDTSNLGPVWHHYGNVSLWERMNKNLFGMHFPSLFAHLSPFSLYFSKFSLTKCLPNKFFFICFQNGTFLEWCQTGP